MTESRIENAKLWRHEGGWVRWGIGSGGRRMGMFNEFRVLFGIDENILEMDGVDGCTT